MSTKITFTISPDGVIIDAEGFSGGKCLKELEKINKLLKEHGIEITITDQKMKQSFYAPEIAVKGDKQRVI